MCRSDAEPFCLNSQSILQCSEERLRKLGRRGSALSRRTQNIESDNQQEEDEFEDLVVVMCYYQTQIGRASCRERV